MDTNYKLTEYFTNVETKKEHNGYFCSVKETLTIVILGSFCGLRNVKLIHQWASSLRVREFLLKEFKIGVIPCYYWLLCLMKLIVPESLNQCFVNWVQSLIPETLEGYTVSFDGKTVSSRRLTAEELLKHARLASASPAGKWRKAPVCSFGANRMESVESMHWLLDVHFGEDFCRVEDKYVQQNLNIVRKIVLNCIKRHKETSGVKHPLSKIMFDCLLEPAKLLDIIRMFEN